jgi:lipopolysaccharide heptosyltransferase II
MQLSVRKILIIFPGGIGDIIMFEPCFKVIKNNFSECKIDIFTMFTPASGRVIGEGRIVNKIIDFDWTKSNVFKKIEFIYKLRKEKYDISIVTTGVNPLKGGFLSYLVGAKMRVGEVAVGKRNIFYTHVSLLDNKKHVTETSMDLLRAAGLKIGNDMLLPFINVSSQKKEFAQSFLKSRNLSDKIIIGFHPGSSKSGKFRRWPKEYFIELGHKILYNFQYAVILIFGGPGEEKICEEIKNELNGRAISITGRSMEEVVSLVERCDLFVSSDSGLSHVASALKVETIAMWGPSNPNRTGPHGRNVHILREECRRPYNIYTVKDYNIEQPHACLKKITPEMVFNKVKEIL